MFLDRLLGAVSRDKLGCSICVCVCVEREGEIMGNAGVRTREWLLDNNPVRCSQCEFGVLLNVFFFSQLSSSCYIAELSSALRALKSSGIATSRVTAFRVCLRGKIQAPYAALPCTGSSFPTGSPARHPNLRARRATRCKKQGEGGRVGGCRSRSVGGAGGRSRRHYAICCGGDRRRLETFGEEGGERGGSAEEGQ